MNKLQADVDTIFKHTCRALLLPKTGQKHSTISIFPLMLFCNDDFDLFRKHKHFYFRLLAFLAVGIIFIKTSGYWQDQSPESHWHRLYRSPDGTRHHFFVSWIISWKQPKKHHARNYNAIKYTSQTQGSSHVDARSNRELCYSSIHSLAIAATS